MGVGSVNLLDMDSTSISNVGGEVSTTPTLKLSDCAQMNPQVFQEIWGAHTDAFNKSLCTISKIPSTATEIEILMKESNIMTMASGPLPDSSGFKFFLYAQENDDNDLLGGGSSSIVFLVQLTIASTGDVSCVVKTSSTGMTKASSVFPNDIAAALDPLGV